MTWLEKQEPQSNNRGPLRLIDDIEKRRPTPGGDLPPSLLGVVHAAEWALGLRMEAPVTASQTSTRVPTEDDLRVEHKAATHENDPYCRGVDEALTWLLGDRTEPPFRADIADPSIGSE
jgi:hypothetical protein